MAEPRAASAAEVAVSGHDVLLATKLHLPRPRPGFVPRPRLAVRLDEGLARGLVLVCAPAGYGKTVALADWARRGGRAGGLLSPGAGGHEPGAVLGQGVGRGAGEPGSRGAAAAAVRPAAAVVVRRAGDGADQRTGRPARRRRGGPDPGRLPPDRRRAGTRVAAAPGRASAAGATAGAGQPVRPAAAPGTAAGPRSARGAARRRASVHRG